MKKNEFMTNVISLIELNPILHEKTRLSRQFEKAFLYHQPKKINVMGYARKEFIFLA